MDSRTSYKIEKYNFILERIDGYELMQETYKNLLDFILEEFEKGIYSYETYIEKKQEYENDLEEINLKLKQFENDIMNL